MNISAISQISQTTNIDATLVPNKYLRNAAKIIEKGKVDIERIKLLNDKIEFLNQRIAIKDSIIFSNWIKDSAQAKIKKSYEVELSNLIGQRDIAISEIKSQNKQYRRQKRKTLFAGVAAAGVTAAIFLFLK